MGQCLPVRAPRRCVCVCECMWVQATPPVRAPGETHARWRHPGSECARLCLALHTPLWPPPTTGCFPPPRLCTRCSLRWNTPGPPSGLSCPARQAQSDSSRSTAPALWWGQGQGLFSQDGGGGGAVNGWIMHGWVQEGRWVYSMSPNPSACLWGASELKGGAPNGLSEKPLRS